jgi:glutamine synthetase
MGDVHDELKERAQQDGIEFFLAMFVDMDGKPCAKLVPAIYLDDLLEDGAGFAGFAAGAMGQSPADPDILAIPDPASYTPVPWKEGVAVLHCDPHVEGEPWPYAPRVILKRQLERAAERGLVMNIGLELEYSLVKRDENGRLTLADELDTADKPCYEVKALSRMWDHLSTVSRYLNQLGWGNYANDHEDGNGQFENNITFADALTTADRAIFFRYMVHSLAQNAGIMATFMPKPFSHVTGNGMHMHSSLWEVDGGSLFEDPDDPRGLGLTDMAYHYIGGILDHGRAMAAVTCPSVNSYKRIGVGVPKSGSTWAPAYVSYGGNNRTVMLRVPDPGRVEHRGVDGSANPYLAATVVLAAGLDGIDRKVDPGEPVNDDLFVLHPDEVAARGISHMPVTLGRAVEVLVTDEVLREALGQVPGGDYIDYYAKIRTEEYSDYHAVVTQWEVDRYLTLF